MDFDPAPAFGENRRRRGRELFRDEAVEENAVLEISAVLRVEEIADDHAACCLIGCHAHETCSRIACVDQRDCEVAADDGRLYLVLRPFRPDPLLGRPVVRHGECGQLLERHCARAEIRDQLRRDAGELQPLLDEADGNAETRSNVFGRPSCALKCEERIALVGGMKRQALEVLRERDFDGGVGIDDETGNTLVAVELLAFGKELEGGKASSAGHDFV